MRTLLMNEEAIRKGLKVRNPWIPPDLLDDVVSALREEAIKEWGITHEGILQLPDSILFTDLSADPSDADLLSHARVVLVPGPYLYQSRRLDHKDIVEVEGIPVQSHYVYRWLREKVTEREAKMLARNGWDTRGVAAQTKEWLRGLDQPEPRQPPTANPRIVVAEVPAYRLVDEDSLGDYLSDLRSATLAGWDTETTGLRKRHDTVVGISVSTRPGTGWYLPTREQDDKVGLLETLRFLENPNVLKTAHNARFDQLMVRHTFGIQVGGQVHDSQVLSWMVGAKGKFGELKLKTRAWEDLGFRMIEIDEFITKGNKKGKYAHMGEVPPEEMLPYAAPDADATLRLTLHKLPEIRSLGLQQVYDIEQRVAPVLHEMEWQGMFLRKESVQELADALDQELREVQTQLDLIAGKPVNLQAPAQLNALMFKEMGFPRPDARKRTADGGYSTDKDTLQDLLVQMPGNPFILALLKGRELITLKRTFISKLPDMINPFTGRIHSSFNSTNVDTGRLSSSDPNLQNIPARTKLGQILRQSFIGEGENVLLVADKSQIEPRILTHMSRDPGLLRVYREGLDLYREIMGPILNIPPDEVNKTQRQIGKVIGLSTQYGAQEYTVAKRATNPMENPPIIVPVAEAKIFLQRYFVLFAGVKNYIDGSIDFARTHGYAVTELGRRRWLPDITHYDPGRRSSAERQAINHPIQGMAADLFKLGLIHLWEAGIRNMVNVVHDEYILEGPRSDLEAMLPDVQRILQSVYPLRVPIVVDPHIGESWADAK